MAIKRVKRRRPLLSNEDINPNKEEQSASQEQSPPKEKNYRMSEKKYSKSVNPEGVDTHNYLYTHIISNARLLKSSEILKIFIQEVEISEKCSILVSGISIVAKSDGGLFFSALMKHAHGFSRSKSEDLYRSVERLDESLIPKALLLELEHVFEIAKAEERGFLYEEKKNRFIFNANVFSNHFLKRCYVRSTKDGRLFLYNRKGFYEELSEVQLGKLIRIVMHEGRWNSWKSTYEVEIYKALQREASIVEEMDVHRNLLNVENGMLELNKFRLIPHSPEFLSTVQIPIKYDSASTAPKFSSFMDEITDNDGELVSVHQELLGYWLTAETIAEKAVYYYGSGANGKSVFAAVITALVGKKNVCNISLSKFNDSFGLEGMIGKSLNISAENEMGGKALNTENFKAIVSGDSITINIKYRPAITYRPFCRQLFLVNNIPDSTDVTNGYFRKIMIIPFPHTFKKAERNVNLKNELLEELPGILNWALSGLKRLRENDYQFSSSKAINSLQEAYYKEQNPVQDFYDELIIKEEGCRTKQSDFYNMYIQWITAQGIDDKGTKSRSIFWRNFKIILNNENISINRKKVKGIMYFDGLKIRDFEVRLSTLTRDIVNF
ncbi:DNA primase family protein [Gracilibacillus kekensis]|uniref:Putative DNA primase/helicase n=1 Tax=Gracilibacillus kekensis TaxID=1027249 RepID=A0A1M7QQA4_9BACI|nr:phage/plasmid primase, P4 family [Gracilibacillus kekensis]SHN33745.1 putative DNA primase/helicase [Gracilibacillus kekensis]